MSLTRAEKKYPTQRPPAEKRPLVVKLCAFEPGPAHVYLPFYTCNALLEPFIAYNIPYSFYAIDNKFEIAEMPVLKDKELLLYINYFGIKNDYVSTLSDKYGDRLVVDCTQSYFTIGKGRSWYFNSTRKFFGVPDWLRLIYPRRL